ncbi:MAG TPA: GNAT family N-acetyltransferase [Acidimicrobiales bacterium]|jgi:GNAT superfamily N-acetyltransferase
MTPPVVALARADIRRALPAVVRSFWDYEETLHLLPDERRRRHGLPRALAVDLGEAARHRMLFGATRDDAIVGVAAWLPPDAYPEPWHRMLVQGLGMVPALPWLLGTVRESLRGLSVSAQHHHSYPPHYFLRVVGVDPALQGSGLGAALLAPGIAVADAAHAPCFLFTSHRENTSWYARAGFAVVEEFRPTPTWPTVWAMWREAV